MVKVRTHDEKVNQRRAKEESLKFLEGSEPERMPEPASKVMTHPKAKIESMIKGAVGETAKDRRQADHPRRSRRRFPNPVADHQGKRRRSNHSRPRRRPLRPPNSPVKICRDWEI